MDLNPFSKKNDLNPFDAKDKLTKEEKAKEVVELEDMKALPSPKEPEYIKALREYGGLESNIPINHPYWKMRP